MPTDTVVSTVARVNGVALHAPDEALSLEALRQRAYTELLRQSAQRAGLLDASDAPSIDAVISEAACDAIDALLTRELNVPEPSEDACRRYYAAHVSSYRTGERVRVRHILFAVTKGVDVTALRKQAEAVYLDVRCPTDDAVDIFAKAAARYSNCPSGAHGGDLGWLTPADCAPEFAHELFGRVEVGVLARLAHSRYGLHIVEVLEREPGVQQSFDAVSGAVAMSLRQQSYVTALRQYLRVLAGAATVESVDLEASQTPLVQ
ncbi:MAG TPA: peptidylprolyl isomerase [Burkholderiales bacterium]|nr:peptidylprolyl isomerase [Burkholderiales bacterium]